MNQDIEDRLKTLQETIKLSRDNGIEGLTISVVEAQWLLDLIRGLEEQRNPLYTYLEMTDRDEV